jgi:hypothetical protein
LVLGLVIGALVGRATAPGLEDEVRRIQNEGRAISAQLRVIAVHQEASSAGGDGGTAFALSRARTDLERTCREAVWIPAPECQRLVGLIDALASAAPSTAGDAAFARAVEQAASEIDRAFGNTDRP